MKKVKKKMDDKKQTGVEVANSYKYYGLNKKSEAKDTIPEWIKKVVTDKKEKPDISKYKGIYP